MSFDYKNASAHELHQQFAAIAKASGDDRFLTRRELRCLPDLLMDGEQVFRFSSGLMRGHSWLIVPTDRRILFLNKKWLFGMEHSSISLDQINSISGQTGLLMGSIAIEDGASTHTIENVLKRTVNPFVQRVNEVLYQYQNSGANRRIASDTQ